MQFSPIFSEFMSCNFDFLKNIFWNFKFTFCNLIFFLNIKNNKNVSNSNFIFCSSFLKKKKKKKKKVNAFYLTILNNSV